MLNHRALILCSILFSVLLFSGCQATSGFYKGAKADRKTIVPLHAAAMSGERHWRDLYVKVDYHIAAQNNKLNITGGFSFADYPQINLARVYDFKLKLFLLNTDHVVLDYVDLARAVGGSLEQKVLFDSDMDLSPAVVAVSFGYEGEFITETGARESVWNLPKKSY